MMDLINDQKMSAIAFRQMKAGSGEMMACIAVRGTFHIYPDHPLIWAEKQDPIQFEDAYLGDPHTTSLIRCSDIIPFKPKADLTLLGWAVRPKGISEKTWRAGIKFNGNDHVFQVIGRRYWEYHQADNTELKGCWRLSEAEDFPLIPLSWTLSYGGKMPSKEGQDPPNVVRENPIGCGYIDPELSEEDQRFLAPSILNPDNPFSSVAGQDYEPYGCAPVSAWWKWRQQYAGTYDEAWLNEIHPRLPSDFDYSFYQYAPPNMIYDNYFRGGEDVWLVHLHPFAEKINFKLPTYAPIAKIKRTTSELETVKLNLDGCHIVLTTGNDPAKVFLTWRTWVPFEPQVSSIRLEMDGLESKIREKVAVSELQPLCGMNQWPVAE